MDKKLILVPIALVLVAGVAGALLVRHLLALNSEVSALNRDVNELQLGSGGQTTDPASSLTVAFGSVTGGTAGSIMFSDGTNLAQDNGSLFFNDSQNSLGVGTNTPGANTRLSVNGITLSDILIAEDHLKVSYLISTSTATSTISGETDINGPLDVGGRANSNCVTVTDEATMVVDAYRSNCFALAPTADRAVSFKNLTAGQSLYLDIFLDTNISLSFPSTTPVIMESTASSSIRGLQHDTHNVCAFRVSATNTTAIRGACNSGYDLFR